MKLLSAYGIGVFVLALANAPMESQEPAQDVVDIRGIWREKDLDPEKAALRGLNAKEIETPRKTKNVAPKYPRSAKDAARTGVVKLECRIDTDGVPRDCRVTQQASAALDEAALDAVTQWRYAPLKVRGEARPALVELTLAFRIG